MFVIYRKLDWYLIYGRSGTDSKALYIYTYISMKAFLAPMAENREFKKRKKEDFVSRLLFSDEYWGQKVE
jgi:hypothetical protein